MNSYNVLIDTNIFDAAKYNFAGGSLHNFKKYCNNGTATLFTNDIILREVKTHIMDDVGLIARKAKNVMKQGELFNAITPQRYKEIEEILLNAPNALLSQFEAYMADATILPNDGLPIEQLFDDYFEKRAPFEGNEKKKWEFPDAVVIMSIKRYIQSNRDFLLHVVSDDNGWKNALTETPGVCVYKSLSELLKKIAADEELYDQLIQYMETCLDELEFSVEKWFVSQDWSAVIDSLDVCIECDELVDMFINEIALCPEGVEYIDQEGGFASSLFSGSVKFYIGFNYIDHTYESYDREDRVYHNTIYGKGAVEVTVPFTASITILICDDGGIELNSTDFDEITLGDVEVIDYELTPYRNDDDEYFSVCPECGNPIGIRNDGGNGFCADCALRH